MATISKITVSITTRWWFKPSINAAILVASVIGRLNVRAGQRFMDQAMKPITKYGFKRSL